MRAIQTSGTAGPWSVLYDFVITANEPQEEVSTELLVASLSSLEMVQQSVEDASTVVTHGEATVAPRIVEEVHTQQHLLAKIDAVAETDDAFAEAEAWLAEI